MKNHLKQLLIVLSLCASPLGVIAQSSKYDVNGDGKIDMTDVTAVVNAILWDDAYLACPDNGHPHWINLGLPSGTKWACCNIEGQKPSSWGKYCTFTKAQQYNLPTLDQIKELVANTTTEWTTLNGTKGLKFTASNGGSIFLPAAGYVWAAGQTGNGDFGNYWSSTPYGERSAYVLNFDAYSVKWDWLDGGDERSVRTVRRD